MPICARISSDADAKSSARSSAVGSDMRLLRIEQKTSRSERSVSISQKSQSQMYGALTKVVAAMQTAATSCARALPVMPTTMSRRANKKASRPAWSLASKSAWLPPNTTSSERWTAHMRAYAARASRCRTIISMYVGGHYGAFVRAEC